MVKRRVLLTLGITALAVTAFGALAASVSVGFAIGALFSVVIGGVALMTVSCPKCGHFVLFQKQKAFGTSFPAFIIFPIPEACRNCGQKL